MTEERKAWWRCFTQMAVRLLEKSDDYRSLCLDVLKEENVSEEEAWQWLETDGNHMTCLDETVREYCFIFDDTDEQ